MKLLSSSTLAALFAASAMAQGFNSNIGSSIGPVADDVIVPLVLGFNFTFPDGTTTSTIDLDSNGRVLPSTGTNVSIAAESVALLLSEPSAICIYWDDQTPVGLGRGDIYYTTSSTEATITFCNTKRFGATVFQYNDWTYQIQLRSDNSFSLVWDNRVFSTNSLMVGCSAGNGALDPGEVDLSAGLASAGGSTVYEYFNTTGAPFDLYGREIAFSPDGIGGYNVTSGPAGVTPCGGERYGRSCPVTFEFFPDGTGGYFMTRGLPAFFDDGGLGVEVANASAPTGILGDDLSTPPIPIGFNFTFPGGGVTNTVEIANNGRVFAGGASQNDFSPTVAAFLADTPAIALYWTDMSSQRGSVRVFNDPAGQFSAITFDETPKFFESATLTFQLVLRADNSFAMNYLDVSGWATGSGLTSDDVLIGFTSGNGATDPGPVDFSNSTISLPGQSTIYQLFDSTDQIPDIHTSLNPWALNVNPTAPTRGFSGPRLGTNFNLTMEGVSSGTFSANLLLGFDNPNIPLSLIGIGLDDCFLLVNPIAPAVPLTISGDTASFALGIPNDTGIVGFPLHLQGANIAIGETLLGVVLTNGVRSVIQP